MGFVQDVLDKITGEKERQRIQQQQQEAERTKAQQLQAEKDKAAVREVDRAKLSKDRQREAGPAERMLPRDAERVREAAIQRPEVKQQEAKQEPVREVEATRMEYTRTPQAAPSMPGMGTTFVNRRLSFPERMQQQEAERVAKLTPDERHAEEVLKQLEREKRLERSREQDRGLCLERELGD